MACVVSCFAFPPAPYYTLYGLVRDQVGQIIRAEGATLILLKNGEEVSRTPITRDVQLDQNYELAMSLDANRPGLTTYSDKAIVVQTAYSLAVEMNGERFYPIEASGTLTAGKGGERVRMDLNLGEDKDGDGLPDVWEEWQLWQAGKLPGDDGKWALDLLDKNGDFDGDGQKNFMEYIAGTFAGDAGESFKLDIKEKTPETVKFELFAITGKTYTIERSADMKTWTRVNFHVGDTPAEGAASYQATDVRVVPAFTGPETGEKNFYRLTVR